jgi:flagellar biosynthesis/type III secretory pathway protein FliH
LTFIDNGEKYMKRALGIIILSIAAFAGGYYLGRSTAKERIVYQPKTEYIKDPDSVLKSTLNSEIANAKKISYNDGYTQGLKVGKDEGYKSGYIQGTEYGKSLILDQIDLRVQEAERTNKNIPLFKVKRE